MKTNDVGPGRAVPGAVAWPVVLAAALRQGVRRHATLRRRCVKKGAPRAVHQLRVETRRLLALADLIGAACGVDSGAFRRSLRRILRDTAKARDATVELELIGERIAAYPELRPIQARLRRKVGRTVRDTRSKLRHGGKKLRRRGRSLADAAGGSGGGASAARAVMRTLRDALATAQTTNREAQRDPGKTHRARLALKRLRYVGEAMQAWVPGLAAAWLERLRRRQHLTGEIHDLQVLARRLARYAADRPGERGRLQRVRRWVARREEGLRRRGAAALPVPPAPLRRLLARRGGPEGPARAGRRVAKKPGSRGRRPTRR